MKQFNYCSLIQFTKKVVTWIYLVFTLSRVRPMTSLEGLFSVLDRVARTRGDLEAIRYTKGLRAQLLNFLSGNPVRVPGIRCTKDGIPLAFGVLVDDIRREESPELLRILTTILYCTRALKVGTKPNVSSIVDPPLLVPSSAIGRFAKSFWRTLGYLPSQTVPKSIRFKRYHFTTKAGPNGQALWTSLRDLYSLPDSLLESIKFLGGDVISERMDCLFILRPIISRILPCETGKIRRLTYFPDKEDKVRVVAILDYWSQTVLKPLHGYLFGVLRKIKQDCTFDQGSFLKKLDGAEEYFSIDLTAATDRFPIALIEKVLGAKLPHDYMSHWHNVMVGFPFELDGKEYSYSVGNPMGAYSSWASFAVAHHYLVYECCREARVDWSTLPYCLLGDDIVIGRRDVAELYLSKIRSLGVEVSDLKTHRSRYTLEFAKRLIHKGQEITPFPISALAESEKRSYLLTNLLIECEEKDWRTKEGVPASVQLYYKVVKNIRSKVASVYHDNSYQSELMTRVMNGTLPACDALNALIKKWGFQIRPLTEEESQGILSNIAVECFALSNPFNERPSRKKCVGLGPMAISLVEFLTGLEIEQYPDLGFKSVDALPLLGCYGIISEMYTDLSNRAREIDTREGGRWPMLLKTMALPWDDRVFSERSNITISRAGSVLGSHLRTRFEFLSSPVGRSMLG